jgi:hypothetical protein
MVPSTGSESDPPVLNYQGDPGVIVVRWFGRPCDADSDLFLRPTSEPGYTVELEVRMYNTTCRSSRAALEARLHLSSPLDASAIYAWSTRVAPPSPTPSPSATSGAIDCGYPDPETRIVNPGDLIVSCRPLTADESQTAARELGPGVLAGPVAGDRTRWRLLLSTTICTHDFWLTPSGSADSVVFELSPAAQCILSAAKVIDIEVVLSRPVDVRVVRVVPV